MNKLRLLHEIENWRNFYTLTGNKSYLEKKADPLFEEVIKQLKNKKIEDD